MRQVFSLNSEPHIAEIGDTELVFQPEADSDQFVDAWAAMQKAKESLEGQQQTPESIRKGTKEARKFITTFMDQDSAKEFAKMKLPDRILVQLVKWITEIYGNNGGGQTRPTGSSNGSAPPQRKTRARSTATSRSKA